MTGEIIIAEWQKNGRERIRVRLDSYKGQPVICCRAWYQDSDDTWKPGRGGLTIALRHLPQLADAIAMALATARQEGLLEGQPG